MKFIVIILGVLILLLGISILISPDMILDFFESNKESQGVYIFGVLFRTVMGILLVLSANESKHPAVVSFLGYFSLLAALVLVVSLTYFGQESVQELLSTIIEDYKDYAPVAGVFSVGIGAFLIYAFLKK